VQVSNKPLKDILFGSFGLPGCWSQGTTKEALEQVKEAIKDYLHVMDLLSAEMEMHKCKYLPIFFQPNKGAPFCRAANYAILPGTTGGP